jgi:hypothetical protein
MLKLDFDRITKKNVRLLLSDFFFPYEIREGNKGVNVRKECQGCIRTNECYVCWLYTQFDDRNRLKLNIQQKNNNLSHNILWDIKKGKKKPGEWVYISNSIEADIFLRRFTGYGFWVEK